MIERSFDGEYIKHNKNRVHNIWGGGGKNWKNA